MQDALSLLDVFLIEQFFADWDVFADWKVLADWEVFADWEVSADWKVFTDWKVFAKTCLKISYFTKIRISAFVFY
jgi:hypothetical protein